RHERSLRLVVSGRQQTDHPDFTAVCDVVVPAGEVVERWLRSSWTGDASFVPDPGLHAEARWEPETSPRSGGAEWVLDASLRENERELERLSIGGVLE